MVVEKESSIREKVVEIENWVLRVRVCGDFDDGWTSSWGF